MSAAQGTKTVQAHPVPSLHMYGYFVLVKLQGGLALPIIIV